MNSSITKSSLEPDQVPMKIYTLSPNFNHASNCADSQLPEEECSTSVNDKKISRENLYFTLKVYQDFKICVYKPLIPLKLAQFCWFGAGSFMGAFITIFLKQRGVSLSQLSWMNVIAPAVQLTGTTLTGVIADKSGRSKPVLVANLLLVMTMIVGILLMPTMKNISCNYQTINFPCIDLKRDQSVEEMECYIKLNDCYVQCLKNISEMHNEASSTYHKETEKEGNKKFSLFAKINGTFKYNESCYFELPENLIDTCSESESRTCQLSCTIVSKSSCQDQKISWSWMLMGYIALYVLFLTAFSNVYRCLDVTAMALVKEHNGDFGLERFFAISGNLLISPLAGYIVAATTVKGGEKNYAAAFYLFIGMVFLVLAILYKLPVRVNAPGEKMRKKSLNLLKNPDILSLLLVVLVLGTAWNFTKIFVFWYLEDLKAPSLLVGLIPSVSALYGLPFLLTANWWVKKIGSTQLIVVAFLGYVLKCIGYSFLINPWYSLILESFGAVTYYLLWVAVVIHSHELAPEGMRATVVAVAGAMHYSVGKATGGLVGGLVMNSFGGRVAFRLIAVICLISAVLYALYLRIRHFCVSKELQLDHSSKIHPSENQPKCIFVLQKNN